MFDPNDNTIAGNAGYDERQVDLYGPFSIKADYPNSAIAHKNRPYTQREKVILGAVALGVISVVLFVAHII